MNEDEVRIVSSTDVGESLFRTAFGSHVPSEAPIKIDSGKLQNVQVRRCVPRSSWHLLVEEKGEDGAKEFVAERLCVELARTLDETGATLLNVEEGPEYVAATLSLRVLIRE